MIELVDQNIKIVIVTVSYTFKKLEDRAGMLYGNIQTINKTKSNF